MAVARRMSGDRVAAVVLAALVTIHAALALHAARRSSVTIDEFAHLPAGVSYWQQGTFAVYHHNPPLAKLVAALPVLAARPAVDYSGSWARARAEGRPPNAAEFGSDFMRANPERYFALFRLARAAIVAVSIAGLLLLYSWARALWGVPGGLLAAGLWTFEPDMIAHASLATTDLVAAVTMLAASYAFWRWLVKRSTARAAVAGLALGLALLAKFTALLLIPVFVIIALCRSLRWRRADWLLVPAAALVVLNAGYAFEGTGRRLGTFPFLSPALTKPRTGGIVPHTPYAFYRMLFEQRQNRFEGTWLGALPVPVPEQYLLGLDEQRFESDPGLPGGGYAVYLRGAIRRTGWWWYYLDALALKTPLGLALLGGLALFAAVRVAAARLPWREEIVWILPALAVLAAMSAMTGLDLGVRYVLPVFPFLFLGLARVARPEVRNALGRPADVLLAAGIAWIAAATCIVHPHELSYFNEIAGGPSGGHRYLLDSNLDWGQDLLELRRWLDGEGTGAQPIGLAYFGAVDPALAGVRYFVPPRDPRIVPPRQRVASDTAPLRPGLYAVSVNFVQGLPHRVLASDGSALLVDENAFGYFRLLRPVARAGYSIWIYRVGEEDLASIGAAWEARAAR
jgi:hypothetical protein